MEGKSAIATENTQKQHENEACEGQVNKLTLWLQAKVC